MRNQIFKNLSIGRMNYLYLSLYLIFFIFAESTLFSAEKSHRNSIALDKIHSYQALESVDGIRLEIVNESKWAKVEAGKVESKKEATLLYLNLDLTRGSHFPFGYHVHVDVYDHEGKLTESIEQKIRHRHHLSRYLGHLHRARFTPEKLETHPNTIGRIKIVSHEGK